MSTTLRVLVVEGSEDDTRLMVRELERGGYNPVFERVETAQAMTAALAKQTWDVVLADYNMPQFSAPEALKLLQKRGLDIPFIIVSGSIGEDTAVAAMKAGAHDYLMKDNLKRLVPAVERELLDAGVRRECKQAEEELQKAYKEVDFADYFGFVEKEHPAVGKNMRKCIIQMYGQKCFACSQTLAADGITIDHIVACSRGGTGDQVNL